MWNLREYQRKPRRLAEFLPWAALIRPGVLLNKDGSFQRTLRLRQPDLESSGKSERMATRARLNNVLRRLGSHWCLHMEAARRPSRDYPESRFENPLAGCVDRRRKSRWLAEPRHFETRCYLTMTFLPPREDVDRLSDLILEGAAAQCGPHLEGFLKATQQIADLMADFMPEVELLDDAQTLSYLHSCVSDRVLSVAVPEVPFYLDEMITDRPLCGGFEPRLGEHYLQILGIRAFPDRTLPCLLERLEELPIPYRFSTRYIPMDRIEATRRLSVLRRQWFAKRKGLSTLLREVITKQESRLEDSDANNKALDTDAALQELGADLCSFGQLTMSIITWDADRQKARDYGRAVSQIVDSVGLVSELEDFHSVQAFLGTLPGHAYANVRRPLVSSLNLCDLIPLSCTWSGPRWNEHLNAPPLMMTQTCGSTPFRLDIFQGDVGHTLIIGPTGAGKSTLLSFMALQFLRYPRAQVIFFDKGASCRAATLAVGGLFYHLGADDDFLSFQPLARIDEPAELSWSQEWMQDLLSGEQVELSPAIREELWNALKNLASQPLRHRTLSTLAGLVQETSVRQAIKPYTLSGLYGAMLDECHDHRDKPACWTTYEMEALMQRGRRITLAVLTYLFRTIERKLDGRPTLLVLDEAWLLLADSLFSAKIMEWLKVLRKKNTAVIFATQSLSDVAESRVAPAIIENCLTRIFLPNAMALEPQTGRIYESFGLSLRQRELLGQAIPKRQYYYQGRGGNRLFELGLDALEMALCGSSRPADQALMTQLWKAYGPEGFCQAYLQAKGLGDVALELHPDRQEPEIETLTRGRETCS